MLYYYASIATTIINLLLAIIIVVKSPRNLITRFYALCIGCLITFGVGSNLISIGIGDGQNGVMSLLVEFLFCIIPFFFLHFIVLFLRRYDLLKSKRIVFGIYFAGLFSYVMLALNLLPHLLTIGESISSWSYIYYITWTSIFISIGIVIMYSLSKGFAEKKIKSNFLLIGFASLLLVLPSPFTYSISRAVTANNVEWFGITSAISLLVAVFMLFRYKIMVTVYDSIKSALVVMNDIFMMTDENLHIETATGSLQSLLGYTEKEMIGRSLNDFIEPKDYIPTYLQYVHKNKMREARFDAEMKNKEGKVLTINFSISPVFENESLAGFVGIGRDVTNEKLLEQKHREAQKLESVTTLAAGIAHDFNKLLTVIMGYARLVDLAKSDPETLTNSSEEIKKAVGKGSELVKQILTFARQTTGKFENVQVNTIVFDISSTMKEVFPSTIPIKTELKESLPLIKADPVALVECLNNLCTNARDAMSPGGGTLSISTTVEPSDSLSSRFPDVSAQQYVGVHVGDTGVGMTKEIQERIFEPFFTTKDSVTGGGLGLAVVYGVVKSHNGFLDLESVPGKGTVFHLYFPAV